MVYRFKKTLIAMDPAWRTALLEWAAVRLGLAAWAAWIWFQQLMPVTGGYFYYTVAPLLDGWQGALMGMWQRWDSIHYQAIAENFYSADYLSAFFPAYPLLGRFLSGISGLSPLAALLILSNLAVLFSLVLLHRITLDLFGEKAAGRSLLSMLLFPTAFFLFGAYPQSLSLLWMLLAYDQARRGHWLIVGLTGLIAGMTHGTVVPMAAMLAVQAFETLRGSRFSVRWLALTGVIGMPFLGTALFMAWREAMGFPAFIDVQMLGWDRIVGFPWEPIMALFQGFPGNYMGNWVLFLNTALLVVAGFSVYWAIRHLPLALKVYQVTLFLFLLTTRSTFDPLLSFDRFILVMFPLFIFLGAVRRGKIGNMVYFSVSVLLSMGVSAMYFMWKWIG